MRETRSVHEVPDSEGLGLLAGLVPWIVTVMDGWQLCDGLRRSG